MKKITAMLIAVLILFCTAACAEDSAEPVFHQYSTVSSCGYSIEILWQEGIEEDAELRETILSVIFNKYPVIRETFGTNESRTIRLHLTSDGQNSIVSGSHDIFMDYTTLKEDPSKLNTLVWFLGNKVINGHPNPEQNSEIDMLSLGLQAYIEARYAVDPTTAIWLKPYEEGQQLTDHHQVAGAFIKWIADTYGEMVPVRLNRALHEGYYKTQDFWPWTVGNSLDNLWNEYASQSAVQ